ncbi:MAG: FkbM family methyltransferase, partial [Sulfurifustis sp.]
MKVLIVSAYPPDPAPEANHALHISEHLARSGLDVHVLCKKGSIAAPQSGIVVHAVMENWDWPEAPRLQQCLREARPDVVLLLYIGWVFRHEPMITYLPTFCRQVLPGVPCITQFENVDKGAPTRSLAARLRRKGMQLRAGRGAHALFGTLLRDSARVIALSTPHRAGLLQNDPAIEDKCDIVPPPPLIRFCTEPHAVARQRARDALGIRADDFVWMYWGYIYPGKGVETLLQAFRSVSRRNRNARLVLVGGSLEFPTGPISCSDYYNMVRQLPDCLGIADRVTWTGDFSWDSEDGSLFLHAGDVCVLPFDYGVTLNNSSLAAATTHDLPVIATELPVGRDQMLEHGRNVYLCPPGDPEILADAMQSIGDSPDLRERLRAGARALAREWHDWSAMTERLIGILESAASAPGTARHLAQPGPLAETPPYVRLHDIAGAGPDGAVEARAPRVSVVVAVYNVARYLSQCLDSLVHQTLKDAEIIVVDDASTDDSVRIIRDYQARHPNVRLIQCAHNRGLATVRNIGMRAAKGEYIAFADGDDWVDTRMCEVMYRRAAEDDADVLIADATVFYEDTKSFGRFFDLAIRKSLDPKLRTMPFQLLNAPRVLLLEPVAWPKIYKRSFLERHALSFEDGMNSYEDMCFHFSVLLKAERICLIDDALPFYRQNRPGQISGRTNRKVFEVFDVFRRIHENLSAWKVSTEIWALLVRVQLRQFDWLLKDRVRAADKREFMARVAEQFAAIPAAGLERFAQTATAEELTKVLCMRRQWLRLYERVTRQRWPLVARACAVLRDPRPATLKHGVRRGLGWLRRRAVASCRSFVTRAVNLPVYERQWQAVNDRLAQLGGAKALIAEGAEPLIQVCRIRDHTLFLSYPSCWSGMADALWRMEHDYYLTQTAVFRPGDVVVDVGAHVGVVSLYLAKKYPFIQVYAVEPDPLHFACLERNIEINGATNVTPINKAISGDTDGGSRTLYVDVWTSAWASIHRQSAASRQVLRTTSVATMTLEQLF